MKNNYTIQKRGVYLLASIIISTLLALPVLGQTYGPENPPPKDHSITFTGTASDGEIGRAGGKVYTITNITLANSTEVYYTMLADAVKLSMDGSDYAGAENMPLNGSFSNLPGGILSWTGATQMPLASGGTTSLLSKFIMTVYDLSNAPIPLVDPATTGFPTQTGGAVLITGNNMVFKVRMEMLVSDNGGSTYTPHLDYYDAAATPAGAESAYSTYDYGFYWENDRPELTTNLTVNVDEGDTVIISNSLLVAEDVESSLEEIVFVYDSLAENLPVHGKLLYDNVEIVEPDTFTMADIIADLISYVHDGSETTKDSISLQMFDGDGAIYLNGEDSLFFIMLNITPVDDPPSLILNTGATIDEDSILTFTDAFLFTTDPESSEDLITYTLDPEANSNYPENGLLKLNGIPLSDGDTFTQEDIVNGNLVYDHDGSATLSDGFIFQVEDGYGHLFTNDGITTFFFDITVNPVNDNPILPKNYSLEIDEGGTGIISNALLAASDEESGPEDITFTLDPEFTVEQPNYGIVLLNEVELGDGESFTMDDINNNLVTYQHNGDESTNDFFVFNVSDPEGGIAHDGEYTNFQFRITITPVNDPPSLANPIEDQEIRAEEAYSFAFPENTFIDVDEGDSFTYTAMLAGDVLPEWLTFDGASRTFSGTPLVADKGIFYVVVNAQDLELEEIADTFMLEVMSPVGIFKDLTDKISIYPNPFKNQFTISFLEFYDMTLKIQVLNILGESIFELMEESDNKRIIDLSEYPSGIYFVKINMEEKEFTRKVVKW